jgi:hypothetical protein
MLNDPLLGGRVEQEVPGASVYVHRAHLAQVSQARQRKHDGHTPGNLFAHEDQFWGARYQASAQLCHNLAVDLAAGLLGRHVQRGNDV